MLLAMIAGGILGALGVPAVLAFAAIFFLLNLRAVINVYGGGHPTSISSYRTYPRRQYQMGTEVPSEGQALAFAILEIGGGFLFGVIGYGIGWLVEPRVDALVHTLRFT